MLGVLRDPDEGAFPQLELPYSIDPHLGPTRQDKDNVFLGFVNMLRNLFACGELYQEDGNICLVVSFAEEIFNLNGKKGVRAPLDFVLSFHRYHMASFFLKNQTI
jgi:hypothetical protein